MGKRIMLSLIAAFGVAWAAFAGIETANGIKWWYKPCEGGVEIGSGTDAAAISTETTGDIVVPDTLGGESVVAVGANAFRSCSSITSVRLPESVKSIGSSAFANGSGSGVLTNVNLSAVTNIGYCAFASQCGLLEVNLSSCQTIGSSAFEACSGLRAVDLSSCCTIEGSAFEACSSLQVVNLSSCQTIGASVFHGCSSLCTVNLSSCQMICNSAFYGCSSLYDVDLSSCQAIGNAAFHACSNLGDADLSSCCTIESSAFAHCSNLSNIVLSSSIESVGSSAFDSTKASADAAENSVVVIGGKVAVGYKGTCPAAISIPSGVTLIADGAFSNLANLDTVSLPQELVTIGSSAFSGTALDSIDFPPSVTRIGSRAFANCGGLTSLTLPTNLTTIGCAAFSGCDLIESVEIPASVTSMDSHVFQNCSTLTSVIYKGLRNPALNNCVYYYGVYDYYYADSSYGNSYSGTPDSLVTYVPYGATGWCSTYSAQLPTSWNRRAIQHYGTPGTFSLTLDVNGGDALATTTYTGEDGQSVVLPSPSRTGWNFTGWYDAREGGNYYSGSGTFYPAGTHTLYAHWTARTAYTVTLNFCDGVTPASNVVVYAYDSYCPTYPFSRTGYSFDGWYDAETGGNLISYSIQIMSDRTLYAHWTARTAYTVTLNFCDGVTPASNVVAYAGDCYYPPTPTRTGYSFVGWYDAEIGGSRISSLYATYDSLYVTSDRTVYAHWKKNCTLTLDFCDGVTSASNIVVVADDYFYFSFAPVRTGYTFSGWYDAEIGGNCVATRYNNIQISADRTLYAQWKKDCILTLNFCDGVTPVSNIVVAANQSTYCPVPARSGYIFNGWYDAETGGSHVSSGGYWMSLSSDRTLYAQWREVLLCTVTLDYRDGVTPAKKIVCTNDTYVSFGQPTREGFEFSHWTTSDGDWYYNGASASADTTFYAVWYKNGRPFSGTVTYTDRQGRVWDYCVLENGTAEIAGVTPSPSGTLTIPSAIPDGTRTYTVTSIGTYAFEGATALTGVVFPSALNRIAAGAFRETGLLSVAVPASVISCSLNAFNYCENLQTLTFGAEEIALPSGEWEFCLNDCPCLKTLTLPSFMTGGDDDDDLSLDLDDLPSLETLTVPEGITEFTGYGLDSLTSLSLPSTLLELGGGVCSDCWQLDKVVFHGGVPLEYDDCDDEFLEPILGVLAFANSIYYPSTYAANWEKILRNLGYGGTSGAFEPSAAPLMAKMVANAPKYASIQTPDIGPFVVGIKAAQTVVGAKGMTASGETGGLTWNSATGTLSGTPTTAGTYQLSVGGETLSLRVDPGESDPEDPLPPGESDPEEPQPVPHTLMFDPNGGTCSPATLTVNEGDVLGSLPIPVKMGYSFAGWLMEDGKSFPKDVLGKGASGYVYSLTNDLVLTASYAPIRYPIAYVGLRENANSNPTSYTIEDAITFAALPDVNGWIFSGWSIPSVVRGTTGELTVTALWTKQTVIEVDDLAATKPVLTRANTFDGYVLRDEVVVGTIQLKLAKGKSTTAKLTATITISGEKKISVTGTYDVSAETFATIAKDGRKLVLTLGADGFAGTFGAYDIIGVRNIYGSKAEGDQPTIAQAKSWEGAYALTFADATGCWNGLSVTIAAKGKVKVTGTLTDGTKVSATAQLLVGSGGVCCVPVVWSKKGDSLAFVLWLSEDGLWVEGLDAEVSRVGPLAKEAFFKMDGAAFADVIENDTTDLQETYLPIGISVDGSAAKWVVAGGARIGKIVWDKKGQVIDEKKSKIEGYNVSSLKLTFTVKTGLFKGSFKAYTIVKGALKSTTVNVTGIVVNGVGYGTATVKGKTPVPITIE